MYFAARRPRDPFLNGQKIFFRFPARDTKFCGSRWHGPSLAMTGSFLTIVIALLPDAWQHSRRTAAAAASALLLISSGAPDAFPPGQHEETAVPQSSATATRFYMPAAEAGRYRVILKRREKQTAITAPRM